MPGTRPIRPELARLLNLFGGGRIHMGLFPVRLPPGGQKVSNLQFGLLSGEMFGIQLAAIGGAVPIDTVWPVANRAVLLPIRIEQPSTIIAVVLMNGSVVSGNVDVGIFSPQANRVASNGGTAQSGVNTSQTLSIGFNQLQPGQYFVVVVFDNVVARVLGRTLAPANLFRAERMFESSTAVPLPAVLGVVNPTQGFVPLVGVQIVSVD